MTQTIPGVCWQLKVPVPLHFSISFALDVQLGFPTTPTLALLKRRFLTSLVSLSLSNDRMTSRELRRHHLPPKLCWRTDRYITGKLDWLLQNTRTEHYSTLLKHVLFYSLTWRLLGELVVSCIFAYCLRAVLIHYGSGVRLLDFVIGVYFLFFFFLPQILFANCYSCGLYLWMFWFLFCFIVFS